MCKRKGCSGSPATAYHTLLIMITILPIVIIMMMMMMIMMMMMMIYLHLSFYEQHKSLTP